MNILLLDVDSKDGNLALAKLLNYYRDSGNNVEYRKLGLNGYPSNRNIIVDASNYDKVFASNLFEINQNKFQILNCKDISIGGMGSINPELKLNDDIYNYDADQSVFIDGVIREYLTRGCIRKCYFCKVWKYEGCIKHNKNVSDIVKDVKAKYKFLDNNILAYSDHLNIFNELVDKKINLQFIQGLDIRLINDENAELLSKMRYIGEYIFAFDDIKDKNIIASKLSIVKKYIHSDWKCKFYIYHNDVYTSIIDTIWRAEWCRENKVLPYVMRDQNCWAGENKYFLTDYAAYCNQPSFFKKMTFEEFVSKRHKNSERIEKSLKILKTIKN